MDEEPRIDEYTFQTHKTEVSNKKLYIYYVGLKENSTIELNKHYPIKL